MVEDPIKTDTRRSFTFGDDVYYINTPTSDAIRKAEWQYYKVFNEAVSQGLALEEELKQVLLIRGVIGDDYEKKMSQAKQELDENLSRLFLARASESSTLEELEDAALQVSKSRDNFLSLSQRVSGPMSNTCEQIAEDARVDYLVSTIIEDKAGTKVWKDYDAYIHEARRGLTGKAKIEVMLWMQGLDSDFIYKTPEAITIKEVNEKRKNIREAVLDEIINNQIAASSFVESAVADGSANASESTESVKKKTKKIKNA